MIFGWDGKIPLRIIFIISLILLVIANSLLINTYRLLHAQYEKVGKPIDLGDPKNYSTKDTLKITMICNTILLWILLIYSEYKTIQIKLPQNYFGMFLDDVNKGINNQKIFFSTISIMFSCLNIYLSNKLAKNTKTISTPF
jgi:hypothetical protein